VGALDGLRVIDAGINVQGPQAAALLRDWGAEVVKVELPGAGDQSRSLPLAPDDPRSGYYVGCNRGKRSITVDLRVRAGREVFLRLVDGADVLITNFRPGTMEGWDLGYDVLAARNPGLVYGSGSTFGPLGPDATDEGNDLSAQAAGGLISTNGVDGGEPTPVGAMIADHIASLNLAAGILAALLARTGTGRGQRVDSSLLGGQIWAQASEYTAYFLSGRVPGRANRGSPLVPGVYGLYPTADGWIAIAGARGVQREALFRALGRPDLFERYGEGMYWGPVKRELHQELAPRFATRSTAEWCEVLSQVGIRHAPVRDYEQVTATSGVWANGYLVRTETGDAVVGTPVQFSDTPASPASVAPELGQHTEEVLLELGLTWDDIGHLREAGAL
jgi:crotonobetainyl-CoA:carnitine CoA-transferase CaiB-like acyl-CoA transferase